MLTGLSPGPPPRPSHASQGRGTGSGGRPAARDVRRRERAILAGRPVDAILSVFGWFVLPVAGTVLAYLLYDELSAASSPATRQSADQWFCFKSTALFLIVFFFFVFLF